MPLLLTVIISWVLALMAGGLVYLLMRRTRTPNNDKVGQKDDSGAEADVEITYTSVLDSFSDWLDNLNEGKTCFHKALFLVYSRLLSKGMRARSKERDGTVNLIVWIAKTRVWMVNLGILLVIVLLLLPWIVETPIFDSPEETEPVPQNNGTFAVTSQDSPYFGWYAIGGTPRVVPSCLYQDHADELKRNELQFFLDSDLPAFEKSHSRCLLHTNKSEYVYEYAKPYEKTRNALADAPSLRDTIASMNMSYQEVLTEVVNISDSLSKPMIYALRDGRQYLRLTIRVPSTTSPSNVTLQRRMVPIASIISFLDAWRKSVADSVPGTTLHYCMAPEFIGIEDPLHFHLDTRTNTWEIWLTHTIIKELDVFAPRATKEKFSPEISPFTYKQNKKLVEDVPDPLGNNHLNTHYDSVVVSVLDVGHIDLAATDMSSREQFWTGFNDAKGSHDPTKPFALALPLSQRFLKEVTLTGSDTVCYYHCRHIRELLKTL